MAWPKLNTTTAKGISGSALETIEAKLQPGSELKAGERGLGQQTRSVLGEKELVIHAFP